MKSLSIKGYLSLLAIAISSAPVFAHNIDLNGLYSPDQLDSINWEKAERITLLFEDNVFEPDELTIKKNKPYIFKMVNVGERSHDFVDLKLFHNISVKRLSSEFGRINTHHIHSLYLKPGGTVLVYFVPHHSGEFEFFCSISGHRDDGMEGYINIVD